LPNLDASKSVANLRLAIYDELEEVRKLRNRIAHHEPIFTRNLANELARVETLIRFRCGHTADWMMRNQWVTSHLQQP
jgi:hypothetical protein